MGDLSNDGVSFKGRGVDDSADLGQFYYADPGVYPAYDDFWGGILYRTGEQKRITTATGLLVSVKDLSPRPD